MTFSVVQPPKEEQKFAETGKELYDAATRLGMNLDVEGFLYAWANSTRVVVQRDKEGVIISMAMVSIGRRWVHADYTASLLAVKGNREETIEFVKTISNALGATHLFIEDPNPVGETDEYVLYSVKGIKLQ